MFEGSGSMMVVYVGLDAVFFSDLAWELFYKTLNICQHPVSKNSILHHPFQNAAYNIKFSLY